MKYQEISKNHEISMFCVTERTNSCHRVTSDWFVTRFGNEQYFFDRYEQKCSSGHRSGLTIVNSPRNVFPQWCHCFLSLISQNLTPLTGERLDFDTF